MVEQISVIEATGDNWTYTCGDGPNGLLGVGQVDHTITDWPYEPRVEIKNAGDRVRDPGLFGFAAGTPELRKRAARAIASTTRRWALVFCAYEETHLWRADLEDAGMRYWQQGHFRRIGAKPQMTGRGPAQPNEAIVICHGALIEQRWNGGGRFAEWTHGVARGEERVHETQKPTTLMRDLVLDFTDPGEVIADIFGGSATTGVAAIACGRKFFGWEIDPEKFEDGVNRLRTPLFEPSSVLEQLDLISGSKRKSHVARARSELDRAILDIVRAASIEGIGSTEVSDQLVDRLGIETESKELQRALTRLLQKNALRRSGKTSSTRYFLNLPTTTPRASEQTGQSP